MKNFLYFAPDGYISSLPNEDWYLVIGAGIEDIKVNSDLHESRLDTKDVSNWLSALQITSIITQNAPKFIVWKQADMSFIDDGYFKLGPTWMGEMYHNKEWLHNDMMGSYHKVSSTLLQHYIQQFCKSVDVDIFVIKPHCNHQKHFIEKNGEVELINDFVVTKEQNFI